MAVYETDFAVAGQQFHGGRALRSTGSGTRRWLAPGEPADVDLVVICGTEEWTSDTRIRVFVRGDTPNNNQEGYYIDFRSGALRIAKFVNGSYSSMEWAAWYAGLEETRTAEGIRYAFRFRVQGTSLQLRSWLYALEDEPTEWHASDTDSSLSSGFIGFNTTEAHGQWIDYIAVDTNGGDAPLPGETPGANQYVEDFAGQEPGTDPDGWVAAWGQNLEAKVEEHADHVLPFGWIERNRLEGLWRVNDPGWGVVKDEDGRGGKVLRFLQHDQEHHRGLSYEPADGDPDRHDAEIMFRFRGRNVSAWTGESSGVGAMVRGGLGSEGSQDGYHGRFRFGQSGDLHALAYWDDGSETVLEDESEELDPHEWYIALLRINGDQLDWRVWKDEGEQADGIPEEPILEAQHSALSDGWPGLFTRWEGEYDVDWIVIATGGDTAKPSWWEPPTPEQPPENTGEIVQQGHEPQEVRRFRPDFETQTHGTAWATVTRRPDAIALNHLRPTALGPAAYADTSEGLIARAWQAEVGWNELRLRRTNKDGTEWLPWFTVGEFDITALPELPQEADLAFDQNGHEVIFMEAGGELWVWWFDPQAAGGTGEMILSSRGQGRTPRAVLDDPYNIPSSEILLWYIRGSRLRYRVQSERFETEHETPFYLGVNNYLEDAVRTTFLRLAVVYSERNPATGIYELRDLQTSLYPYRGIDGRGATESGIVHGAFTPVQRRTGLPRGRSAGGSNVEDDASSLLGVTKQYDGDVGDLEAEVEVTEIDLVELVEREHVVPAGRGAGVSNVAEAELVTGILREQGPHGRTAEGSNVYAMEFEQ